MLAGKNIVLRSLKYDDLYFINKWRNNLENKIMTQGYRLPVSLDRDEEWLKSKMVNSKNDEIYFILVEKDLDIPIGIIQLTNIDYMSGTALWGFIIGDETKKGKGYSIEAPHLLFDYAFRVLNLRKIYGYLVDFNKATFKMHEKIGKVHHEGCLKEHYYYNNKYWDVHVLSFFRKDFTHLIAEL